jgi:ABC-type multidrug transport system fused ATPase/permease subunit
VATLRDLAEKNKMEYGDLLNLQVPVKVDGEESSVPLSKVVKSYQLEGHLNRKLMETAEERKTLQAQHTEALQGLQAKATELETGLQLAATVLQGEFSQVDWNKLKAEDATQYMLLKQQFEERKGQIVQAYAAIEESKKEAAEKQQATFQEMVAAEQKKLENALPELADKKTAKAEVKRVVDYLVNQHGYSEQEASQIYDHRWVLIARDAARYHELMQKSNAAKKVVRKVPKVVKPSPSATKPAKKKMDPNKTEFWEQFVD